MKIPTLSYNIIYIYGPDGSGKSTVCRELVKLLNKKGIGATYRWMRFNHYLSKVVNIIGHLTSLAYYKKYPDETTIGYHHYYRSKFLSITYCISTIFDTVIASISKLWLPLLVKRIVVVDRFVFDMMVDLAIDTRNSNLLSKWPGFLLNRFLLPKIISIYLNVENHTILKRRPDIRWDENFPLKVKFYRKICKLYGADRKVSNNGEISLTLHTILKMIR